MCKNVVLVIVFSISFFNIKAQELMNISGESVTIQEFNNTLMKNNHDKEITKEYLDSEKTIISINISISIFGLYPKYKLCFRRRIFRI